MATRRQGRAGVFEGASRTLRRRQAAKGPGSVLTCLSGIPYVWDMASDRLTWGANAHLALGIDRADLPATGQVFTRLVEPGSGLCRGGAMAAADRPNGSYDTRYGLRFGPDRVVMVQDSGRWQPDSQGRPALVRGQLRADPRASTPDLLPRIVNRRSDLLLGIQNDINEAVRLSHTCTLIVGAFEDDTVEGVEDLARRLRPMMRRHDHFAALGPNRFALTLTACVAAEAASAMKRLATLLASHPGGSSLRLGAACAPDHTFQAVKLLRFAEEALAAGEERGETATLHRIRPAVPSAAPEKAAFDLIGALNDRSLTLACRAAVDGLSRAPALLQACAALPGRDGHVVPLGPLPDLEEANLALLVDGRMLELAAERLSRRPAERLVLPVSPATLGDPQWLPMLAAHLGARPGIESRLLVEISEAALDHPGAKGRLDTMKALGIGIALGGFGTGHASPAHLQSMPVDLLKIDGVFIQPLPRSTDDRLFVRTLVDMAHRLGIATMAEWVDDAATAELLAAWGVDYLQGGLFGEFEAAGESGTPVRRARRA